MGKLAKHKWVLVYALDQATTAIPKCTFANIKRILEDKHACASKQEQLILEKLETNRTFTHQEAEWERQARMGRNQSSAGDVCKTILACTTLGSSAAMLTVTVVISVKTMTQSVAMARLEIHHGTNAGQDPWKRGLPAGFIDAEQMSVQELMALKTMPHTILDGNHHN